MNWLKALLSSPDRNVRAMAVPCPRCWAPPRSRCYRWNGKADHGNGVWTGRRATVHPERRARLYRKTGLR